MVLAGEAGKARRTRACVPVGAGAWDVLGRRSRSLARLAEQDGVALAIAMTGISYSGGRDPGRGGLSSGTRPRPAPAKEGAHMSVTTEGSAGTAAIRPFTVEIPE